MNVGWFNTTSSVYENKLQEKNKRRRSKSSLVQRIKKEVEKRDIKQEDIKVMTQDGKNQSENTRNKG